MKMLNMKKIQGMNKEIEELLDKQCINAVEGLVDVLKGIKIKLNSYLSEQGHLSKPATFIHDMKVDLENLRCYVGLESIEFLRYTMEELKGKYGPFVIDKQDVTI